MDDITKMVANGLFLARPYFTKSATFNEELTTWGETVAAINYTLRQNNKLHNEKEFLQATGYADKFYTGI